MWDKRARILSNHDGDTLTAVLDQGFGQTTQITVRLFGVWAPELKEAGGPETRDFVTAWVNQYTYGVLWPFLVTTMRTPRSDLEVQTLGRYVALVETVDRGHNLNLEVQAFVTERGYGGGTGS
jgi:endonuclease YncB( thermonuclease family)